ncbi:hypothetical protein GCM10010156_41920 [Planobispora rosea]|uniref:Beta-lactamase n=1 Tax=Planobispora rosea TaxID=35762 RepID=A0A8J3S4C6_PLARO|nr:serine hydrolase [Planobispora rosea]GGS78808.1 hypothetical protein GCM10010156_41920 [Planobispora rosea]GIH85716.1 hypothetical protein Pro02_41240 [Planobispora rosea]
MRPTSRPTPRPTRLLALALALATVPVATLATAGHASAASAAPAVVAAPEIPDSPVGRQLRWFLGAPDRAPLAESELAEHVNAAYLKDLTVKGFNDFLTQAKGLTLEKLTEVTDTALSGTGTIGGQEFLIRIAVDGEGKINLIGVLPPEPPAPRSWKELDARLRKVAPATAFAAARIDSRGRCEIVHGVSADKVMPLGSIFKVYVLGAVAEKIRDGKLSWDSKLTIKPEWKSPSEGGLYERPDNSTVTVREAAKLMISISDNTATDILIHTVGRKAVEAKVRQWSGHAERNIPFLTTREWALLKAKNYPEQAKKYLSLDVAGKRAYLKNTVAKQSFEGLQAWKEPREIHTIEWFGSPRDVCRAFAGILSLKSKPLHEAMSANDLSIGLDRKKWPLVWAKGGSESGVLGLAYLARSAKGRTYLVAPLTNNPDAPLDESKVAPELISLSRGAFSLAAKK